MSPNTKQILAITLGSVGLVIGIFAMITAYNAKQATENDSEITSQVQAQFAAAQTKQDALEKAQASKAEELVNGLSKSEKSLIQKINGNSKSIKNLKKQNKNQNQKINTLTNRDNELESELSSLEKTVQNNYKNLSGRINRLNNEVNDLQQSIRNLRNRVSIDEDFSN